MLILQLIVVNTFTSRVCLISNVQAYASWWSSGGPTNGFSPEFSSSYIPPINMICFKFKNMFRHLPCCRRGKFCDTRYRLYFGYKKNPNAVQIIPIIKPTTPTLERCGLLISLGFGRMSMHSSELKSSSLSFVPCKLRGKLQRSSSGWRTLNMRDSVFSKSALNFSR